MRRAVLPALLVLALSGCPQGGGGAAAPPADPHASPEAVASALSAAAQSGDWAAYLELFAPADREEVAYVRVASVVIDARTATGPKKESALAMTQELGLDLSKLPPPAGDRAARRKALLEQVTDLPAAFVKAMKVWEGRADPRFTPRKLKDPGQLGEVTKDGEDKAQGKTTSAGGAGPEGSWTLDFVRVEGKWYAARNSDLN